MINFLDTSTPPVVSLSLGYIALVAAAVFNFLHRKMLPVHVPLLSLAALIFWAGHFYADITGYIELLALPPGKMLPIFGFNQISSILSTSISIFVVWRFFPGIHSRLKTLRQANL